MRNTPLNLFLPLLGLLFFYPSFSQSSKIEIGNPDSPDNYQLKIKPLPELIDEDADRDAFYSIFWIFSNGNYIHAKPVPNPKLPNPGQIPLEYEVLPGGAPVSVNAILTEYYTNDRPPPPVDPFIGNSTDVKPPKDDERRIPNHPFTGHNAPGVIELVAGNVYMESSVDTIVPGRKIVFAISYKVKSGQGMLHFFYNAKRSENTLEKTSGAFAISEIMVPDYGIASPVVSDYNFGNTLVDGLAKFGNVISYNVSGISNSQGSTEGRLFIVLDADQGLDIQDNFVFFTAVTQHNEALNNYGDRFDQHYLTNPLGISYNSNKIQIHNDPGNPFNQLSGFHYQDFSVSNTHDPNHLCITDLCRCNGFSGNHVVEYTLTFCNADSSKSNKNAQSAVLNFRDINGLFECFELGDISRGNKNSNYIPAKDLATQGFKQVELINLDLEPAVESNDRDDYCTTVKFTVNLNDLGVKNVYKCDPQFLLEVDVFLEGNEPETAKLKEGCFRCYIDKVGVEPPHKMEAPPIYTFLKKTRKEFLNGNKIKKCSKKYKDTCKCTGDHNRKRRPGLGYIIPAIVVFFIILLFWIRKNKTRGSEVNH